MHQPTPVHIPATVSSALSGLRLNSGDIRHQWWRYLQCSLEVMHRYLNASPSGFIRNHLQAYWFRCLHRERSQNHQYKQCPSHRPTKEITHILDNIFDDAPVMSPDPARSRRSPMLRSNAASAGFFCLEAPKP